MRGADVTQEGLFVTRKTADYVPAEHPLMAIREILNTALREMDLLFESIYDERGRYSVPPEWLLRGLVLQALYGIRSERLLCEQLGYNMLFRWFVGLGMEDAAWDHSTYTQNRDRLIEHEVVRALFGRVMQQAKEAKLLSSEHFSVDGTLIRAWASHKSFVPKDGPPPRQGRQQEQSGGRFQAPEAQQRHPREHQRSGCAARSRSRRRPRRCPAFMGHVLMDNRSGSWQSIRGSPGQRHGRVPGGAGDAGGAAGQQRKTVGADKSFDTEGFVSGCREINVTPARRAKHLRIRHQNRQTGQARKPHRRAHHPPRGYG